MRTRQFIAVIIVALIGWRLWPFIAALDWRLAWQHVRALEWWQIAAILLFPAVGHSLNAIRWRLFLLFLGANRSIRLRSLLAYTVAGFSTGYLIPSADLSGKALRAVFIQRHGVSSADAVLSLSLELFIGSAVDTIIRLFVIFGFGFLWIFRELDYTLLYAAPIFGILFLLFLIPILPSGVASRIIPRLLYRIPAFAAFVLGLEESRAKLTALRAKPASLLGIIALSILVGLSVSAELWVMTRFLGSSAPFVFGVLLSTALFLAGIFPVVGGVGILESLMYEAFRALNQPTSLYAAFIVILRFKDLLWVLAGLVILAKNGISIFRVSGQNNNH